MFAVVYFGGKQYRIHEKDELEVEKLNLEDGKNFKIHEVLLMAEEDGSQVKIGMPFVPGAHVECQVMNQGKQDKIRVFKFKAKKRYHVTQGHRQTFTTIKVLKISAVEKKAPVLAKPTITSPESEPKSKPEMKAVKKSSPKKATTKITTKTRTKKPSSKKTVK